MKVAFVETETNLEALPEAHGGGIAIERMNAGHHTRAAARLAHAGHGRRVQPCLFRRAPRRIEWHIERKGQVCRAYQKRVDAGHGDDCVDVGQAGRGLYLGDQSRALQVLRVGRADHQVGADGLYDRRPRVP